MTNLPDATASYRVSNVSNASLFAVQPGVAANGTLTFTPAAKAFGTATFMLTAEDAGGTAFGRVNVSTPQTITITIAPANHPPTAIALSATSISENAAVGTAVGTFSTADGDPRDTFTYTFVSGTGDADNASFTIVGNTLKTAVAFNYEAKNSSSIRVRSTDSGGLTTEMQFAITIGDVYDEFSYTAANGRVTITGYNGTSTIAVIPASIEGMPVMTIGGQAFYNRTDLTEITIPEGITVIEYSAFYNCIGVESISIPSTVVSIASSAFGRNLVLPPESRFKAIDVVATNPNYSSIDGVLYDKSQTALLTVPTAKPGRIAIPASVTTISSTGDRITEFAVDPNNTVFCSIDGVLYNKAVTVLVKVPSRTFGKCHDTGIGVVARKYRLDAGIRSDLRAVVHNRVSCRR